VTLKELVVLGVVAAIVLPAVAQAQPATQRPLRPYRGLFGGSRPPDPNRVHHELTLDSSILVGYDDYLTPGSEGGSLEPGQTAVSGSTLLADTVLHYWFGKSARHVSADLRTLMAGYGGVDVDPTLGVDLSVNGVTAVPGRNTVAVTQTLSYEPSLVLGAFSPLERDVDPLLLPEAGVGTGFVGQRSLSSNTAGTFEHRWSPRQTTSAGVSYFRRNYLDDFGYDSETRSVDIRHSRSVNRSTSLGGSYRLTDSGFQDGSGRTLPMNEQSVAGEVGYARRQSPSRQAQFTGGVGATFVQTEDVLSGRPVSYWTPDLHATMLIDIGRSWALGADYRRAVNVLQGVTLESFATNSTGVRANGVLGRRFEVAISAAFSSGATNVAEQSGRYQAYSGAAQVRYALARCCAVTAGYDYYYYKLHDIVRPAGLPAEYDRNAIRVGVSLWLPLYGAVNGGGREGR
jgi:hypothetical protein